MAKGFTCSLNHKNQDTYYDHIAIIHVLLAQYRTLLSIFFMNQYFFLNSNPAGINDLRGICMFAQIWNVFPEESKTTKQDYIHLFVKNKLI